ncbi:MAG: hypothetical protein Q8R69_11750 [Telluria sp.]|nr:hypothetical protein [Telluria sp.]
MAWYKVGNAYHSDAEHRQGGAELFHFLVDVCLPGFITYLGVLALATFLEHYRFFLVHTTTAKLIYIVAGLIIFCIGYACRKYIILLAVVGVVGTIVFGVFGDFFHWLMA